MRAASPPSSARPAGPALPLHLSSSAYNSGSRWRSKPMRAARASPSTNAPGRLSSAFPSLCSSAHIRSAAVPSARPVTALNVAHFPCSSFLTMHCHSSAGQRPLPRLCPESRLVTYGERHQMASCPSHACSIALATRTNLPLPLTDNARTHPRTSPLTQTRTHDRETTFMCMSMHYIDPCNVPNFRRCPTFILVNPKSDPRVMHKQCRGGWVGKHLQGSTSAQLVSRQLLLYHPLKGHMRRQSERPLGSAGGPPAGGLPGPRTLAAAAPSCPHTPTCQCMGGFGTLKTDWENRPRTSNIESDCSRKPARYAQIACQRYCKGVALSLVHGEGHGNPKQ